MPNINLFSSKTNEVQLKAGLNWGFSKGNVRTGDAYIALNREFFKKNLSFFPDNGKSINVVWDDGTEMTLLLEGTQKIDGITKPKQISTHKNKSELGIYLRNRLGLSLDHRITRLDLQNYGREYIRVTFDPKTQKYHFDFSI